MSVSATPTPSKVAWLTDPGPRERRALGAQVDFKLAAWTVARLSLVPVIVLSFMKVPVVATAAIVLFVVADIFDGLLARSRSADGPIRRGLDSVVDRAGIDAGIVGAYLAGILPLFLLIPLLARDAYCALLCARMFYRRRIAIKADWMYRGLNLTVAAGAISAPFVPAELWAWLAGLMLLLSIVVAIDLTRSVVSVERASPSLRDAVLRAGALRRRHLNP